MYIYRSRGFTCRPLWHTTRSCTVTMCVPERLYSPWWTIYLFIIIILYIIIYAMCYYYYHYLILLFGSRWNNKVWRQSLVWVPVFSVTAVSLWILQSSPASTNFSFPFFFFFFLVFYFLVSCSYSVGFSSVSLLLQVTHSLRRSGRTNKIENTTGRRIAYYSQS